MGSAGSSKSYFITQKLIIRAINQQIRILICRRYASTIRNTCFSLFKDILKSWKIMEYCKVNESNFVIQFPNGSEIIFIGLDDEAKLLSLNSIGSIFVEEAFEVPKSIVEQLNLRMRAQIDNPQILMAFNPISRNHWLYEFCEQKHPKSFLYLHSTYKDNPFLSKDYIQSLDELYERNPAKARIFCDGEWGVDAEGLVFQNFKIQDFSALELAQNGLQHRCGMDFGYVDPSVIVSSLYDEKNHTIYVYNEFYKSGCQLDDLLEALNNMHLSKTKIFMDSAEPRSIEFFKKNGIPAYPCIKGQDSVKARISFLQNNQIIIHPSCKNVIAEFENFSYIKDKRTDRLTEKMTHEWSHSIDALGYAYSDIYKSHKLQSISKNLF